jgi:predicted nucleotide-binding protein (sugar kinase/HSP70/actin superfamily)
MFIISKTGKNPNYLRYFSHLIILGKRQNDLNSPTVPSLQTTFFIKSHCGGEKNLQNWLLKDGICNVLEPLIVWTSVAS